MDATRAIAALAVLVSHTRNLLLSNYQPTAPLWLKGLYFVSGFGHQAVMAFFVISGYWITHVVVSSHERQRWSWRSYMLDRLSRLWIVLLPALILGGCLDAIGRYYLNAPIYWGHQGNASMTFDVAGTLKIENFLGSLAFVQTLLVAPFGSNGPLWSLANEFWYYVWFPTAYALMTRRKITWASGIACAATVLWFHQLLIGFAYWLCGTFVYLVADRHRKGAFRLSPRLARSGAGVSALLLAGILIVSRISPFMPVLQDFLIALSFAALLLFLLIGDFHYPHHIRPVGLLGSRASYTIYITHFPMAMMIAAFWAPEHQVEPTTDNLFKLAIAIVATTTGGYLISRVTEANTSRARQTVAKWTGIQALR